MRTLGPDSTPRHLARAVGIILWDTTISNRRFFAETAVIETLKRAGEVVCRTKRFGWDLKPPTPWQQADLDLLTSRVSEIIDQNPWRTRDLPPEINRRVYAASDASGKLGWERCTG